MFALIDKKGMIRCRRDKNNNQFVLRRIGKGVIAIKEDIKKLLEE
jgi:hypothetical protein